MGQPSFLDRVAGGESAIVMAKEMRSDSIYANSVPGSASSGSVFAASTTEHLAVVANSNRFNPENAGRTNAVILDVSKPAAAVIAWTLKTGDFPREVTVRTDDATVYLTNFASSTLQVIRTSVP